MKNIRLWVSEKYSAMGKSKYQAMGKLNIYKSKISGCRLVENIRIWVSRGHHASDTDISGCIIKHIQCTLKLVLRNHWLERPSVLKDHNFLAQRTSSIQLKRPPVERSHFPSKTSGPSRQVALCNYA